MYPSWYGLYHCCFEHAQHINFKWITFDNIDDIHVKTHKDIIETFSGSLLLTIDLLSKQYDAPLIIPWLITGLQDIGIGNIDKQSLCTKKGCKINNTDPVEMFVDRMYTKYNIKRNLISSQKCNNIIYIINKRPHNGIDAIFNTMKNKYNDKFNFLLIDYTKIDFKKQLELMNTTCLCIVGVGTARANTPFLPNGSIEIQTFEHNNLSKNCIDYVDYHIGTLSENIKILNIPFYTKQESINFMSSNLLEKYVEYALSSIPINTPINIEDNIPEQIKHIKTHNKYNELFDKWRNDMSNRIEDMFILLDKYA
jgi:hypothetical protein